MLKKWFLYKCLACLVLLGACNSEPVIKEWQPSEGIDFQVKRKETTNITFANTITESPEFNYFSFAYIYSGAGVAIGDINNDDLPDVFFVGNDVKNRLYLNQGNLQFQDISQQAAIGGKEKLRWSTGVTMADVNNDGWLDIYVCVSGPSPDKQNLLYINNGDLTFTEQARKYGINDRGFSNQAAFFDYDNDGDLDLYIATYPPCDFQNPNSYYVEKMENPGREETDRLYENKGKGKFEDVTEKAGIKNYGLTLNMSISDFNGDGWMDIYASNDFNAPDFLYINNQDGTFSNQLKKYTNHTSNFGMGTDAADIDNDGDMDFLQMDMMSMTNAGQKKNMSSMQPSIFYEMVDLGLHHQYMRNSLQLNNGNGSFSDIAELAGVANTDWSWSALMTDLNNDGWKDIFVTNGMRRSVNNKDFQLMVQKLVREGKINDKNRHELLQYLPVEPAYNMTFVNQGDLNFKKNFDADGLSYRGFTQGAAYGDLDQDGDLDMVINNLDKKSMVVENISPSQNYLRLALKGKQDNLHGIGTKVTIKSGQHTQTQELMPTRGYLSSVEPILHFGLGAANQIDTIWINWATGNVQILTNVQVNQQLKVEQNPTQVAKNTKAKTTFFTDITAATQLKHQHHENTFDDFLKQVLLPHKMSTLGPSMAAGDLNGDGLEDVFLGGASGQSGQLFLQNRSGKFSPFISSALQADQVQEDMDAALFDADGDGDLDLYVVSGGNEWVANSSNYQDRLYINDGQGNLKNSRQFLPKFQTSGSKVRPFDYDQDGDLDLFIGGRLMPWDYPAPATSHILQNENGQFIDATETIAPQLLNSGMVTDALWTDYNQDGNIDLMLVGEWMPITVFEQKDGLFQKNENISGFKETVGWWNSIAEEDMDGDGDTDYVVGNLGLNYKYKTDKERPFQVHYADFDKNNSKDIVLGYYEGTNLYPLRGRECSSQQLPTLKKKFVSYESFATAKLEEVYDLKKGTDLHYKAHTFASQYIQNNGGGNFELSSLPTLAQISCINGILIDDYNQDGVKDILIAGNNFDAEVETPRNDASIGLLLLGDLTTGNYQMNPVENSGLLLNGNVKNLKILKTASGKRILVANNDGPWQVLGIEGF